MLFKPEYDENGKKVLCEMNGIHSDMLMDIYVKKLLMQKLIDEFDTNDNRKDRKKK